MSKVRIVADSTCDLSKELKERYDITVIPLCIVMDEKSLYDGVDITPEEIFVWADKNRTTPKTAAVTFEKAMEILKPMMEEKDDIVFIGISEKMSVTCNVIRMLAQQEEYDNIYVVDSKNLSTGIGLQVIRAAELAAEGKSGKEIADILERETSLIQASFVVDTLTYLARGGRCSAVTALLGNALKLHPMIEVKDGSMGVAKKYRGNIKSVIPKYVSDLKEELQCADNKRVFITHSGCDREIVNRVKEFLVELDYFEEILETYAGGVISSHCGPDTLGVLFSKKA